jgi:hypothetical protein
MRLISHRTQRLRALLSLSLAFVVSGCFVPLYVYVPDSDVIRVENVHLVNDVFVSAGPRRLLQRISKRLEKALPAVDVMDPISFRDAVYPEGGWQLDSLLEPDHREWVVEELGVDLLVLVGAGAMHGDPRGFFLPGLGALTIKQSIVLSAVVFDLKKGAPLYRLRSQAEGTVTLLTAYIVVGIGEPMTRYAVERSLTKEIVQIVTENLEHKPGRIALMAAEASGDPFVSHEDAPITVGHDAAVAEMVNRLADIEADSVLGATSRDDLREVLGEPMEVPAELGVDVYRLTAVAESEERPLFAIGPSSYAFFPFRFVADWKKREERLYAGYLLVAYDTRGKVIGIQCAFIAANTESGLYDEPLELELGNWAGSGDYVVSRTAYEYDFDNSAVTTLGDLRLKIEFAGQDTRERLYKEPGGVLVFEHRERVGDRDR